MSYSLSLLEFGYLKTETSQAFIVIWLLLDESCEYNYSNQRAVKVASSGQITDALFNVGEQYRRNM